MFIRILIPVILIACFSVAQDNYKPWVKAEGERHAKTIQLSKVQYPGDTKIDITYYGLDLTITYQPNYIIGKAMVNALVDTSSITNMFLDLRDNMIVDSVLINSLNVSSWPIGATFVVSHDDRVSKMTNINNIRLTISHPLDYFGKSSSSSLTRTACWSRR